MKPRIPNEVVYVNDHVEIVIGDSLALVDLHDFPKLQPFHWEKHTRGPIMADIISTKPRKRVYKLAAMVLYGHAVSFKNGNRYDLRRANVVEHKPGREAAQDGGIYRHQNNWFACLKKNGFAVRRCFSVSKYGESEAKRMALESRREMLRLGFRRCAEMVSSIRRQNNERRESRFQDLANRAIDLVPFESMAKAYAKRFGVPANIVPHLQAMMWLAGGRLPRLKKKNFVAVNIYEGNAEYEDCVPDIPFTEDGHWDGYHRVTRNTSRQCDSPLANT